MPDLLPAIRNTDVMTGNHGVVQRPRQPDTRFLPAAAAEKLRALREEQDDLLAASNAVASRSLDASDELRRARADLKDLEKARAEGRLKTFTRVNNLTTNVDDDLARLAGARQRAERANAEAARLTAEYAERSAQWNEHGRGVIALDVYVERLGKIRSGAAVTAHPLVKPRLGKGQTPAEACDDVRGQIRTLAADLHAARSAPRTTAEAKASAESHVAQMAARGSPNVLSLLEGAGEIAYPMAVVMELDGSRHGRAVDAAALLAWFDPAGMLAKFCAEIDELGDDENALSAECRQAGEAELLNAILSKEREEEALIEIAKQGGVTIIRRPRADPRAVLHLGDEMPAPEA